MKIISISDVGCSVQIRVAASGKYKVIDCGGCSVEQILSNPLPKLPEQELRDFIWDQWVVSGRIRMVKGSAWVGLGKSRSMLLKIRSGSSQLG